jgi:hypothetical protein
MKPHIFKRDGIWSVYVPAAGWDQGHVTRCSDFWLACDVASRIAAAFPSR